MNLLMNFLLALAIIVGAGAANAADKGGPAPEPDDSRPAISTAFTGCYVGAGVGKAMGSDYSASIGNAHLGCDWMMGGRIGVGAFGGIDFGFDGGHAWEFGGRGIMAINPHAMLYVPLGIRTVDFDSDSSVLFTGVGAEIYMTPNTSLFAEGKYDIAGFSGGQSDDWTVMTGVRYRFGSAAW